jgi:hypothetical protein
MSDNNDEKKFIEEGLEVSFDGLSSVDINEYSVNPYQADRKDKDVYINTKTDSQGLNIRKRTSSLMLGKNVDANGNIKIDLKDGTYISETEVAQAIINAINSNENKTVVCKKTGEKVENRHVNDLVDLVKKSGKLTLEGRSEKIKNQDSIKWSVTGKDMNISKSAGVMMLGNVGIKMPYGDYVSLDEIKKALTEYVVRTPISSPSPLEEQKAAISKSDNPMKKDKEQSVRRVTSRKKTRKWLVIALAIATLISGIRFKEKIENLVTPYAVTQQAKVSGVDISLSDISENEIKNIIDETIIGNYSKYSNSSDIKMSDNTEYYGSSDYKYGGNTSKGIIGQSTRQEGMYIINGLSVVNNGKIVDYTFSENENLGTFIKKIADEQQLNVKDMEAYIHVDGPTCGWVDVSELSNISQVTSEEISKYVSSVTYEASIDDINKNEVMFENNNGEKVLVSIKNSSGELLENGSKVIGSDGVEYTVEKVSLNENNKEIKSTDVSIAQKSVGNYMTWKFTDMSPILALATLLALKI